MEMTRAKKILLAVLFLLPVIASGCGSRLPVSLPVTRELLSNGMIVLVHEKRDLPIVTLKARIGAGAVYEPEEKAGLAAFAGRLITKGTKKRNAAEIASQIEFVGGGLEGSGGRTSSYVECTVLKKDLDLALDLLADVTINPVFDLGEIEKGRKLALAEIKSSKEDPETVGRLKFDELIYGRHPYHRPLLGYEETVKRINLKDLVDFYHKYFVPNNTILAVAGDVDAGVVINKIKKKFAGWAARKIDFPIYLPVTRQTEKKHEKIFMQREEVQIFLGHLGIRRDNPDYYALRVLDVILGSGGISSRIIYQLRDVQGLAYEAYSSIAGSAGQEPGVFLAYMAVSPDNKDRAINGLLKEIKRIRKEPVSPQELEDAKSYLIGSHYFDFQEDINALADYLLFCEVYSLGFDFIGRYPAYIARVTKEQVKRAAEKYLSPEAYSLVVVGPVR